MQRHCSRAGGKRRRRPLPWKRSALAGQNAVVFAGCWPILIRVLGALGRGEELLAATEAAPQTRWIVAARCYAGARFRRCRRALRADRLTARRGRRAPACRRAARRVQIGARRPTPSSSGSRLLPLRRRDALRRRGRSAPRRVGLTSSPRRGLACLSSTTSTRSSTRRACGDIVAAAIARRASADADSRAAAAPACRCASPAAGTRWAASSSAEGGLLLDTRALDRVLGFDAERGHGRGRGRHPVAGAARAPARRQAGATRQWGIAQKQTGADRLIIGGALAANVHGRGLTMPPFVGDVESFTLVDADGDVRTLQPRTRTPSCSGSSIGGYGLFGVVYSVDAAARAAAQGSSASSRCATIDGLDRARSSERIARRLPLRRLPVRDRPDASDDFLRRGVFSCYRPVDRRRRRSAEASARCSTRRLAASCCYLAHTDKARGVRALLDALPGDLRPDLLVRRAPARATTSTTTTRARRALGAPTAATEMITELYVPRDAARATSWRRSRDDFRGARRRRHLRHDPPDRARRRERSCRGRASRWACVIFNLHVVHTPDGLEHAAATRSAR